MVRRSARNIDDVNYRIDNRLHGRIIVPGVRPRNDEHENEPNPQRPRLDGPNLIPSGLGEPNNRIQNMDAPGVPHNMKAEAKVFLESATSALISGASFYYFRPIGPITYELTSFIYELISILKHKQEFGRFTDLTWKNQIPILRAELDLLNLCPLVIPFEHELIRTSDNGISKNDYLFMDNPDLTNNVIVKCKAEIRNQLMIIIHDLYIFKQFSKLLRCEQDTNAIEDPLLRTVPDYKFIQILLEKVSDIISSDYFCFTCHIPIRCKKGALWHLKSKHEGDIDGQELIDRRNATKQRAIEKIVNHHEGCTDCNCTHIV